MSIVYELCDVIVEELSKSISFFSPEVVLLSFLLNEFSFVIRSSEFCTSLDMFGLCISCPRVDMCSSICTYDVGRKMWMWELSSCSVESSVRYLYVTTYLSKCFCMFPESAGRICDLSICALRGHDKSLTPILAGSEWFDRVPLLFRGHGSVFVRLEELRGSDAFGHLLSKVSDTYELE